VLGYGHGDVIRGFEASGSRAATPGSYDRVRRRFLGPRHRDNKGQHTINLAALDAVLAERGVTRLQREMADRDGEETGSSGLRELCAEPARRSAPTC